MKFKKLISAIIICGMFMTTLADPCAVMRSTKVRAAADSDAFRSISLTKGYKSISDNNPCITQKFSADPGVMVYNDRVYVYATNDGSMSTNQSSVSNNTYAQITQINVMSSGDMVNWTDHGSINVAGSQGAARWAGNSWAPCATHKTINGKEKFFLYFANNANGIGVLTSDSPTGPWVDPIGKPLISRSTPNCSSNEVTWLFDPAVFVDTDGTGYLYFGGGVPKGKSANPRTARVVKLGANMTSLAGNPVMIDAPWIFEDSGINKIGNTYYYSYCTNWDGGPLGNAKIAYMTSNNPMGPFTYQGTCFNNPGDFFQTAGNNHHTIIEFKNQFYMFYHAEWLNKQAYGSQKGYRTTHVDVLPFSNGKFGNATGTLKGVTQLANVNPFVANKASNMAWQAGVNVYGLGDTGVAYNRGDWTGVSNVAFGNGASSLTMRAAAPNGAVIRVTAGRPDGDVIGYVNIPATGSTNTYTTATGTFNKVAGIKKIFFTASADVVVDTWQFGVNGNAAVTPAPTPQNPSAEPNLLNTYGTVFDYVGNALVASEILNSNILNMAAQEYNSITVGNEMKPDYILGWSAKTISVDQAKRMGYYIPDNYKESTVPQLDFSTVDRMLKACYDKGLKMRGHTLVWHSQTPDWYFRSGYSKTGSYVSKETMNARMEFFIKTYMNHVCSSEYGSIIYAWDVVNEYLHANSAPSGWQKIYGNNLGPRAEFVKRAFEYTYQCLEYFKLTDRVHLFYNDYNTYMEVNDVIALVNYVNSDRKICAGVGMQSHLSTDYPSVSYYKDALSAFCKQGFEVQITELDAGSPSEATQAKYYYDLMRAILDVKKSGGNITALVWWGMTDDTSWRSKDRPLLYSTYGVKKQAYDSVLQAYFDSGYTMGGNQKPTPTPSTTVGNATTIADGWYYIKNTGSQKYLQVTDNKGSALQNVEIGKGTGVDGQKWKVTNTSDGYMTLTSKLGKFMLDVADGADKDGANIGIYDAHGWEAQRFQARTTDQSNVVTIVTKSSKGTKALDVYNFGTADGTNVCQWSFGGKSNQTWIFEPITEKEEQVESAAVKDGWYRIKGVASGKYLEVAGNMGKAGQNVDIYSQTGADGQIWKVTNTNDGYVTFTNRLGDFMLDVANGSGENNANIGIYNAYAGDAQKYIIKKTNQNGIFTIATKVSNGEKVLDVSAKSVADGANVCQYTANGQTNQQWTFEEEDVNEQQPSEEEKPAEEQKPSEEEKPSEEQKPSEEEKPSEEQKPSEEEKPSETVTGLPSGVSCEYTVVSDWGGTFQAKIEVKNESDTTLSNWSLSFDYGCNVTNLWGVDFVGQSGNTVTAKAPDWNANLAPGQSVTIEFIASGDSSIVPDNYSLK